MSARADVIQGLKNRRPEWSPWITVIEAVVNEAAGTTWDAAVPDLGSNPRRASAPLLAGAAVTVDERALRRLLDRLLDLAARVPALTASSAAIRQGIDLAQVFSDSLRQEADSATEGRTSSGPDADGFRAISSLLPVPFLHACARQWRDSVSPGWEEGYCPVCGAWPAFAELRGIERTRYVRCGRCGGEWLGRILHCVYCGTRDHDQLAALVPEKAGSSGAIDACNNCRGYLKVFTRLQGCAPELVLLEDLRSVDLDVAAIAQGYARPAGSGYRLDVAVTTSRTARRFFAWNT